MNTQLGFIWLFLIPLMPFLGLGIGLAANKAVDAADQQGKKGRLTDLEYQIKKKELEKQLKDLDEK